MKDRKWTYFFIGVFVLFTLFSFAETKKLREIGRYKFAQIEDVVPPEEAMKILVNRYSEDIKKGFELAGYGHVYLPFIEQVKQSVFEEKEFAVGEKMKWMLFRSQGNIKLVQDLEWAGSEPLSVLVFSVADGNTLYEFIMPTTCGNISLVKETVLQAAEKVEEPVQLVEEQEPETEIRKAKIYQDIYALLSDSDLYCSIFIMDDDPPEMQVIGSERGYERTLISDGEIIYVNKGSNDGLETGQLFLVFEMGPNLGGYGPVGIKRGRARLVDLEETRASAKVEKACGPVMNGHYLVPFEEKESPLGKDLGFNVPPHRVEGLEGEIIYLQTGFHEVGSGYWAIINVGEEDGVQVGQQLITYREEEKDAPLYIFGNIVIIDTQNRTSTVKVLSCRDVLRIGDQLMTRPSQ
ncbi:MAG: hypothetical protein JXB23_06780 [Candidatus Aminicenantes bacterium]|nr:hypothetical protein [Candidatus Aminicenantes bacterium]